jgi:transketolase
MRVVPNMTVVDPADATELAAAIDAAADCAGPVYLRAQRGLVPEIFEPDGFEFELGRARVIRQGARLGLVSSGLGTVWALEAIDLLQDQGIDASLLHVSTLKPLDSEGVAAFASRHPSLVTIENHSVIGGLASAVAEVIASRGLGVRLRAIGLPDSWGESGSRDYLRQKLGLDGAGIASVAASELAKAAH